MSAINVFYTYGTVNRASIQRKLSISVKLSKVDVTSNRM